MNLRDLLLSIFPAQQFGVRVKKSNTGVCGWGDCTKQEAVNEGVISICSLAQQHHQPGDAVDADPGMHNTDNAVIKSSKPIIYPSNNDEASRTAVRVMGPEATSRYDNPFLHSSCTAQMDKQRCYSTRFDLFYNLCGLTENPYHQ